MVAIKSITLLAFAAFAMAAPTPADDAVGNVLGGILSPSIISPNRPNSANGNDFNKIVNQQCGNTNQVISCCNQAATPGQNQFLGFALNALQCFQIPVSTAVPGGALAGAQDNKCSVGAIACCSKDPVQQTGLVNIGSVALIGDCSPVDLA